MADDFGRETVTAVQVGLFDHGRIIPNPATPCHHESFPDNAFLSAAIATLHAALGCITGYSLKLFDGNHKIGQIFQ